MRVCGQGPAVRKAIRKEERKIMNKNGKKYRRSPISIVMYVLAAAMLVYVFYLIGSTVQTINEYYAQYGMTAQPMEYVSYTLQASLQYIVYTIVFFMMGCILDAVRMNNKANYLTDEEVIAAKEAKKQAREAKKLARGEAAAVKAGNIVTEEKSVEVDFAKSLDEELKADEKKVDEKKSENKKPRSNNYNRQNGNRQGGNKSGQNRSNGGQRKNTNKKPADRPKKEEAKEKANDGFEAVVKEAEDQK